MSPASASPDGRDLVVVGAGGHGRELVATIRAVLDHERRHGDAPTWQLLGVVDDHAEHPDRLDRLGVELLGTVELVAQHPEWRYALGIGTSATRRDLVERIGGAPERAHTVVHPGASIGPDCRLGHGVVVYERCTVTTNVDIGAHTHLNVGCTVQHDSRLGSFVQTSPGVLVNGDCVVGDDVFLGTGAIVTRGVTVGAGARVGAGAVVLDDVAPGATVVGIPAAER